MSDDLRLHQSVGSGARAQAALDDPAIVDAFERLHRSYYKAWLNSASPEARERLFIATTVVTQVREELRRMVDEGKVAQAVIDKSEETTPDHV